MQKKGKNAPRTLFFGAIGATVCYFVTAVAPWPLLGLFTCAMTGFCVSMLWPGSLIVASERFPAGGVFIFAMMAAGGDMGASVGPQLVGMITDAVSGSDIFVRIAESLALMPEQLGMKMGMLIGMIFPFLAIPVYYRMWKGEKKAGEKQ